MGRRYLQQPGSVAQLLLRGRRPQALVATEEDWLALGAVAERMLFWCGGSILGCRCEGTELRFAVQIAHASLGAVAHHMTAAYGKYVRAARGWQGATFKMYRVIPLEDELFLDDLVLWLHRPAQRQEDGAPVFTAEAAYLEPPALPWVNVMPVLRALSVNASPSAYRWRRSQPVASALFERAARSSKSKAAMSPATTETHDHRPTIDTIVAWVAEYCGLTLEETRSDSRKRSTARAKVIATVLATRYGATVAAAARYLHRNRSTLIEQAERYRIHQPETFTAAESALEAFLARSRPSRE